MNQLYVPGQQAKPDKPPLVQTFVEATPQGCKISIVLLACDARTVIMSPQEVGQFMVHLGNALDAMMPGTLKLHLKKWLQEIEAQQEQAQEVLSSLRMG